MTSVLKCILLACLAWPQASPGGTTYRVGPARPYQSLQAVAGLLAGGDTVLVDGDTTYPGGVVFSQPGTTTAPILIRGVRINGRRPVITGGTNGIAFTTGSTAADHYIFESFEVRDATFRGVYHQAGDLTLRDLVVHHCNNGLMGADNGSGSLLLEYSEFYANGAGTSAHQVYMATDEIAHPGSIFRMQHCYVHDGTGGNNIKSRSERNEIYYNWIEGAVYHELELIGPDPAGNVPAGLKREDSDIVGNVLRKRVTTTGSAGTFFVTRFGGDGTGESKGRYRVVNNTVITGTSAAFRLFDGLESVEMHNNVFSSNAGAAAPIVRTAEAGWTAGEQISGQNNWVQSVLTTIPSGWTGTIAGSDPGFRNPAAGDFSPANGSPLINTGTSAPSTSPAFPFPLPLFPPGYHPPVHVPLAPGGAETRSFAGLPDIGAFEYHPATEVRPENGGPGFRLDQNYPNPFNPATMIRFRVSTVSFVRLVVYNALGQHVRTLLDRAMEPGEHSFQLDAAGLPTGMYYYRLNAGSFTETKRLVLMR